MHGSPSTPFWGYASIIVLISPKTFMVSATEEKELRDPSCRISAPILTGSARTNSPQVFVRVYSRTVAILPAELDRVVTYRPYIVKPGFGDGNEFSLRAMALTQCAGTVPAKVCLLVLSHVTILPGYPHDPFGFDMVDFGWKLRLHLQSSTKPSPKAVIKPTFVRLTR